MNGLYSLATEAKNQEKINKRVAEREFKEHSIEAIKTKLVEMFGKPTLDLILEENIDRVSVKMKVKENMVADFSLSRSACNLASVLSGHRYKVESKEEADDSFLQYTLRCTECGWWSILEDSISTSSELIKKVNEVLSYGHGVRENKHGHLLYHGSRQYGTEERLKDTKDSGGDVDKFLQDHKIIRDDNRSTKQKTV